MKNDLIALLASLPDYARNVFNLLARDAEGSPLVNIDSAAAEMPRREFLAGIRSLEAHGVLQRESDSAFGMLRTA